jgi:hypothetical protein
MIAPRYCGFVTAARAFDEKWREFGNASVIAP